MLFKKNFFLKNQDPEIVPANHLPSSVCYICLREFLSLRCTKSELELAFAVLKVSCAS